MGTSLDVLCLEFNSERKLMQKRTHLIIFISLLIIGIILTLAPINVPAGVDKVYHFIGFFVISVSAISTFTAFFGKKYLNVFMFFLLTFGALLAGLSEDAQKYIPIRGCDVCDWFTNLGGISLACILNLILNFKTGNEEEI